MKKGFTLIELLVVIGIISILVVIMIFYFKSTKDKARDALIKETMGTPLTKLSIEYYVNGNTKSYAAFCNDIATEDLLSKINSPIKYCSDNAEKWAACAQLNSSSDKAWCADSTGVRKEINMATKCKQSIKSCP